MSKPKKTRHFLLLKIRVYKLNELGLTDNFAVWKPPGCSSSTTQFHSKLLGLTSCIATRSLFETQQFNVQYHILTRTHLPSLLG